MPKAAIAVPAILGALALAPAAVPAEDCAWLGKDVAAQVILAAPAESRVESNPVCANSRGLAASTTCRFREAGELAGQLSVVVMEFTSYDTATAAYQKELKDQGSRAKTGRGRTSPGARDRHRTDCPAAARSRYPGTWDRRVPSHG